MTLVLNGTNGLSDVDGSAATPAIRGTDANTGIFFPAADTIAFSEGGAEVMRIDSSGNVGIGTSSPLSVFDVVVGASGARRLLVNYDDTTITVKGANNTAAPETLRLVADNIRFNTGTTGSGTERARIDTSGNLLVGTTSSAFGTAPRIETRVADGRAFGVTNSGTGTATAAIFLNNVNSAVGSITYTTTATSYVTSSDYRLKDAIVPMTGALEKISAIKPCTYKWKVDGSDGQGFIAHELAEVVPQCVTGEKDAVDADGNPQYQGIDTSFLVATLTAAIQELKALVDTQASTITTLTDRITALEANP